MSCKDKDGGTHHYACDCREAYFRGLEKRLKAAELCAGFYAIQNPDVDSVLAWEQSKSD